MGMTETFQNSLLMIEVSENDQKIHVKWSGKSTDRKPGKFITPILVDTLERVHDGSKQLVMDFKSLLYMNSSTITPVIKVLERAKRGNVHLTVLYDKTLKWQEVTFSALGIFQTPDRRVEIRG